jgi:SAM-dependent methyltransferase
MGLWVESHEHRIDGVRLLHFSPEPVLARLFKQRAGRYTGSDIDPEHRHADTVLDIEEIDLSAGSIDVVVCSHVLEHVDATKALSEISRIMAPGGVALLMFPIVEGWEHTFENPEITSPADRRIYFGQSDHVRFFGRDVRDLIAGAGLLLTEFTAEEPAVARYGLMRGEKVFVAAKPK